MKFLKSRRDRTQSGGDTRENGPGQQDEDNHNAAAIRSFFPAESTDLSPSEPRGYPSPYIPDHRGEKAFDKESIPPLGANMQSWSNLQDSRAPSTQGGFRDRTYTEDLDADDVFFNDDDMRRMRLGLTDPNDPTIPSGYTTFAMMNAAPEESHFGQGLEYFGPGYHVGASCLDIFFCIFSIFTYLADVGSDIYLSYLYFTTGRYLWFGLTLAFVAVPSILMSIFSLVLYLRDSKLREKKSGSCHWASRIIFIVLQLAPLLRMIQTLIYGCQSRDPDREILTRRKLYDKMVDEDTDSVLLRLFESFMESAPQLVLQLYIITQVGTEDGIFLVVVQVFGLVTSVLSLASMLVSYQKSLRLSVSNKDKMRFPGMVIMFLWRLFTITARVIALALFASYFQYWVFVVVGIHWLAMLAWVLRMNTTYCSGGIEDTEDDKPKKSLRCQEFCFRILAAFVQIFCFFNLLDGHTRLRCVVFYSLMYVENAVMILGWYIGASTKTASVWYHLPALLLVLLGFWFGVLFQVVYYKCYHPNNYSVLNTRRRILWCIKSQYLSLTSEVQYESDPTISQYDKHQLALNLNINQTVQSSQYMPPPVQRQDSKPSFVLPPLSQPEVADRRTPRPMYPQHSGSLSSHSTVQAGQPRSKIIQKKWQPPERTAAGFDKLSSSFDSESTATTATGASYNKSTSPQTRAQKRARRAALKAQQQQQQPHHQPPEDNEEPLPPASVNRRHPVEQYDPVSPSSETEPLPPSHHQPQRAPAPTQQAPAQRAPAPTRRAYDDDEEEYSDTEPLRGRHALRPVPEANRSMEEQDSFLKVTAI